MCLMEKCIFGGALDAVGHMRVPWGECLHCVVTVFVVESTGALGGKDGMFCHSPRGWEIHVKMVFASLCDGVSLFKCSGASLCSGFNLGAVG